MGTVSEHCAIETTKSQQCDRHAVAHGSGRGTLESNKRVLTRQLLRRGVALLLQEPQYLGAGVALSATAVPAALGAQGNLRGVCLPLCRRHDTMPPARRAQEPCRIAVLRQIGSPVDAVGMCICCGATDDEGPALTDTEESPAAVELCRGGAPHAARGGISRLRACARG